MPIWGMRDRNGRHVYPWDRREIASSAHWRQGEDLLRRSTELAETYDRFAARERREFVIATLIAALNVVAIALGISWWSLFNVAICLWEIRLMWVYGSLWRDSVRGAREIRDIRTSVATKMAGYAPPSERN